MRVNTVWNPATALGLVLAFVVPLAIATSHAADSGAVDAGGAGQIDASGPYQLVQTAAGSTLKALDAHRDEYRRDPTKLHALIDQTLLPHFDSEFAASLVLGRHWKTATPEQRQHFITAFYNSLLNNYGDALLNFTANRLQVLPYRGAANAPYATVDTRIRKDDGSMVAVNYQLRNTPQGWKVWDVTIEGISYDKSFQQDFGEQVDREGLDAVITRLEHGETPAAIKRTTGTTGG